MISLLLQLSGRQHNTIYDKMVVFYLLALQLIPALMAASKYLITNTIEQNNISELFFY